MIVIRLLLFSFFFRNFPFDLRVSRPFCLKCLNCSSTETTHWCYTAETKEYMKTTTHVRHQIWFACHIDPTTPFSRQPHLTHIWRWWCSNWFHFLSWTPFFFSILLFHRFYVQMLMLVISNATSALVISYIQCYVVSVCARALEIIFLDFAFSNILFHPPTVFLFFLFFWLKCCCCCSISYNFRLHPIWW